jgi:peptidoglycan/LPS O-acetylase OafA/YrhL
MVDFFFVLSGMFYAQAIEATGITTGQAYYGYGLGLNLLLSHAWSDAATWNPPSWSISAEFWMYVLFAFICRTANGFSSYNATLLILVSIPIAIDADRYLTTSSSYSGIARCVFNFSFGALSFNLWTSGVGETLRRCSSYLIATVSEAILTFACVALVSWSAMGPLSMLCPALLALTVFVFAAERGPISALLLTKPLMFLGLLSYSIYMVHEFMIARFINVLQLVSKPFMPHPTHSFEIINAPWLDPWRRARYGSYTDLCDRDITRHLQIYRVAI